MECRFCWVMCASVEEADAIARVVVGERLAACANRLAPATSLYWWKGRLEQGGEVPLVLKTRAGLVEALIARITALHSYDCPCVVVLPILAGHAPYLAWIEDETGGRVG
jgi:periplasmic divalent cation tolerance protein